MNKLDCTISELINMVVTIKRTLKSSKSTIFAMERTSSKKKFIKKKKVKSAKKQKKECRSKKKVSKKAEAKEKYFHYDAEGH